MHTHFLLVTFNSHTKPFIGLLSKHIQHVTQESLEQVAPRYATVQMQQAALGTQESVTVRDVIQDGPETTVKVNYI